MLFPAIIAFSALFTAGHAIDLSAPMHCLLKDQTYLTPSSTLAAATSRKIYGSGLQGSASASASRCPRVKPTITTTTTITSGTSSIPTSPGFTPILSETYSVTFNPNRRRQLSAQTYGTLTVSLGPQGQVTTSGDRLPESLSCGPTTPAPSPTFKIPTNCPALTTVTTTATTIIAESITWDACSSDNLINQGFGRGTNHGISGLTIVNINANTDTINATSAVECCAACQAAGCAYGEFLANDPYPYCELYFQDKCEPDKWLGSTFEYNADIVGDLPPSLGYTVFNGPCGQIVYGGSNVCKDSPCE